jgi:hypothetical protein
LLTKLLLFLAPIIHQRLVHQHNLTQFIVDADLSYSLIVRLLPLVRQHLFYLKYKNAAVKAS